MDGAQGYEATQGAAERRSERRGPPARRQLLVGGVVVGLALLLLGAFAVLQIGLGGVPYKIFTKEAVESAGFASYYGFLADVTWFGWVVAATAGLLAAVVLRRRDPSDRRFWFFLLASALTCLLLLDDFAMLHEQWIPRIGLPEEGLYFLYAALFVVLLVWFRKEFTWGGVWVAVAAGAFWAFSIGADFFQENLHWYTHEQQFEDGAKLIGVALWAAFMVWGNLRVLNEASGSTTRQATSS